MRRVLHTHSVDRVQRMINVLNMPVTLCVWYRRGADVMPVFVSSDSGRSVALPASSTLAQWSPYWVSSHSHHDLVYAYVPLNLEKDKLLDTHIVFNYSISTLNLPHHTPLHIYGKKLTSRQIFLPITSNTRCNIRIEMIMTVDVCLNEYCSIFNDSTERPNNPG